MGGFFSSYTPDDMMTSTTIPSPKHKEVSKVVEDAMAYIMRNTFRAEVYRCDFYRGLDQRVLMDSGGEIAWCWRMNIDHHLVYTLVAELGHQPVHITYDHYGNIVVYSNDAVEEAIEHLVTLASVHGHVIMDTPSLPTSE